MLVDLDAAFREPVADGRRTRYAAVVVVPRRPAATSSRSATRATTDGLLSPQHVITRIGELTGPEGVYASGVGQHQMWAAQFIKYERPNAWLNSGGAGTMGYARARRDGREGRRSPTASSGRSTATAASR